MLIFTLLVLIIFELGFAWDTFKKFVGAKQALNTAMQLNSQDANRILFLETEHKTATAQIEKLESERKWLVRRIDIEMGKTCELIGRLAIATGQTEEEIMESMYLERKQ